MNILDFLLGNTKKEKKIYNFDRSVLYKPNIDWAKFYLTRRNLETIKRHGFPQPGEIVYATKKNKGE